MVGKARLTGGSVFSKPLGYLRLLQVASGQVEDEAHHFRFLRVDAQAVQSKEDVHRLEGDPLVAIDEGMVPSKTEPVGRRELN